MLMRMTRYLSSGSRFISSDAILQLVLIHCFGMQLCFAFSVHAAPNDGMLHKREMKSFEESFYPSSSSQVHKRQNSKTATCTCTCETKPEETYNEVKETKSPSWSWSSDDNEDDRLHNEIVNLQDKPADEFEYKPPGAPATARPFSGYRVQTQDHNLKKLTADKVSEVEAPERLQGNWDLGSLYPWKNLPSKMCYREPCTADRDCCERFSICDKSAHVCVDCWYGSSCKTERDCCLRYPHCQRTKSQSADIVGKCVDTK